MKECLFCKLADSSEKLLENDYAYAILDKFPVTDGHTLIIPKRHFADFFAITKPELLAVYELLEQRREQLLAEDPTILGFNVGVNAGEAAGQSIFHCHIHMIPRRKNDIRNPKGGVRGVIPIKRSY